MSSAAWRSRNAAWLTLRLRSLRLQMKRLALLHKEGVATMWLVAGDDTPERPTPTEDEEALAAIDLELASAEAHPDFTPALQLITHIAGLSEFEERALLVAAAPGLDGAFASACAELHADAQRDYPTMQLALSLFAPPDERLIAADALMPTRALRRLRLVEVTDDTDEPLLLRRLRTDERVTDYLRGVSHPDERLQPYLAPLPPVVTSEPAESTARRITTILDHEIQNWPTVNLVGPMGCVASDAIGIACETVGLVPSQLDIALFADADPRYRRWLMSLIGREAIMGALAVVVDVRAASSPLAVAVEQLISALAAPLFIVGTEPRGTRATHVHVVDVGYVTRTQQVSLWHRALAGRATSVNGDVEAIAQQFDFSPDTILDTVSRVASRTTSTITGTDLWDACRDQHGADLDEFARRIESRHGWNDIVVNKTARAQLRELADQVGHRATVYETWGFAAHGERGRGITALFAGPSGTGKTMAAEILAAHLRLALHRIDLAGVVSKYVGETEKNLRRVFDVAEHSGSVLLFDEADALFGSRTEVRDSHDRYANLQVNYLLQRMEDYSGLAILATNRRSALDSAFLRRLRFVVEFPFPGVDERRQIWQRVWPAGAERGELDYGRLARLEIAGGSIRSIAVNAAFLAAADGSAIEMSHIARAAAREYGKLARPVSGSEFGELRRLVQS